MRSPSLARTSVHTLRRRGMAVLATAVTAALLALSVPLLAGAADEPAPPPEVTAPQTEPASTEPPAAEPPATEPPAAEPPAAEPPAIEPPATEPPAAEPVEPVEPPADEAEEGDGSKTEGLDDTEGDEEGQAQRMVSDDQSLAAALVDPPAIITVRVGGVRTAIGAGNIKDQVTPILGVTLQLVRQNNGNLIATCVSTALGDCVFEVPAADIGGGANNDFRIQQPAAPAVSGYFRNPAFVTGLNNGSFQTTNYTFDLNNIVAGQSYVSGVDFMVTSSADNRSVSSGIWQNSYNNPPAQQKCGLSIALIADLSSSIDNAALTQLKNAANGFIDALNGTPSTVALYTFGTTAPAPNTSGSNNSTLAPGLSTLIGANVTTLKNKINGYAVPSGSYTNWDAGLFQALSASYDQVIIITDGNPTAYSTGTTTDGVDTRFNELERAIFSANALKASGKRVIAVGVGSASIANLAAISGPTAGSDYFTGDWNTLATTLKNIATKNCAGSVTVIKRLVPWNGSYGDSTPGPNWQFTGSVPAGASIVGDPVRSTAGDGATNYQINVPVAGTTFTATETLQGGYNLLEQPGGKNAICTKNGGQAVTVTDSGALGFSVPVGPADVVSCTVYNKATPPTATLTVNKQWVINNVAQPLNTFPAGFAATLGGTASQWGVGVQVAPNATGTVSESGVTVPAQYCTVDSRKVTKFNDIVLDESIAVTPYTTPALAPGTANTVTVTNKVTCTSKLTLVKDVVNDNGGTASAANWTLTYNGTPTSSGTVNTVTPGSFVLAESGPGGYQQISLVCSQGLQGDTVTVPYATSVTCTFTNDDIAPTLQLKKVVEGAPDVPASNWTLTAKDGATVVVTGDGQTAVTPVKANTFYDLSETAAQYGGDFTPSDWVCIDGGGQSVPVVGGQLAKLALNQHVVCTITNTVKPVDPTISKTVTSFSQNPDGTWNIVYSVAVGNPSQFAAITYDLSDTLAYGAGIVVESASASGPDGAIPTWNGVANTTLADDKELPKNSTHTYTITVKASVPSTVPDSVLDCPTGEGSGGFMNRANLTVGRTSYPAQDCAEPVYPDFEKDAGSATANADGTWTVTYALTASNPYPVPLYYDLSDDPASGLPSGVTVVSGSITDPGYGGSWKPVDPGKNTTIVDDALLPAGTVPDPGEHSYTISIVVAIADSVPNSALDCETGGLENTGALTSGGRLDTDDACVTIVRPTVAVTKTVDSLVQNDDGTWTIVYKVSVQATGTGVTVYDLADEPKFGGGITIESASATGPAQAGSWNGGSEQSLAEDEPIAGGETDVYTITVTADVAEGVVDSPAADCVLGDGEQGTGFLNTATLIANGGKDSSEACDSPVGPSIDKLWLSTEQNPDSSWTVTFAVDVENASPTTGLVYSLTDSPDFFGDATVLSRTVALNGGAATAWDGSSPLATERSLPADTTDRYVIVFVVTVPAGADDVECTGAPAHGYFNSATVTSGNDSSSDKDCGPAEEGVLPLIDKSVKDGYPRQLPSGDWEIAYEITVSTLPENSLVAQYDLSDTLEFGDGIDVLSASVTGPGGVTVNPGWNGIGDTEVADDVVLPAGVSHVYTVTVTARVDEGVIGTDAADCVLHEGEEGTGFLNTTVLTSGELERTDEACDSPAAPLVEKSLTGGPTQAPDKKVTITYAVTVTNPSDLQLSYDLDDELGFAAWVTIVSAKVTSADVPVNAGWNGASDTEVVAGQSIGAGDVHVFTVTVVAIPTLFVEPGDLDCVPSTPGKGYFNEAVLTSGEDSYRDDACAPIPPSELPTLPFDPPTLAFTGGLIGTGALFGALLLLLVGGVLVAIRVRRTQAD